MSLLLFAQSSSASLLLFTQSSRASLLLFASSFSAVIKFSTVVAVMVRRVRGAVNLEGGGDWLKGVRFKERGYGDEGERLEKWELRWEGLVVKENVVERMEGGKCLRSSHT